MGFALAPESGGQTVHPVILSKLPALPSFQNAEGKLDRMNRMDRMNGSRMAVCLADSLHGEYHRVRTLTV